MLHHLSAALTHRHVLDEAQLMANYQYFGMGANAPDRRFSLNPEDMIVSQLAKWSLNTPEKKALIKRETAETENLLAPAAIKQKSVSAPRLSAPRHC